MLLYADPGSGILIWQLLLALIFGATFYFSKLRHWVVGKLRPERNDQQHKIANDTPAAESISERD